MRLRLALIVLTLSILACMEPIATITPTSLPATQIPSPTATAAPTGTAEATATSEGVQTITIQAIVYVRQLPDASSAAIADLTTGEAVEVVQCIGEWCQIKPAGYVWRGCTSDNPDGLKCEAK